MHKIDTTCHTAHLDPMTGEGLILVPRRDSDLSLSAGAASLHAADELTMMRDLDALGFELALDEVEAPWVHVGWTADGREAFALYGRDPITSVPTPQEQAESLTELRRLAGLVERLPEQRRPEGAQALDLADGAA